MVQQTASVDAAMRSWGVEPATATATAKAVTESGTLGKVTDPAAPGQHAGPGRRYRQAARGPDG